MGQLQVTQVQHRLQETVVPHVDIRDLSAHKGQRKEDAVLSRSLAAFIVMKMTGMSPDAAAVTVTDGTKDNGIDAIAVVPDEPRIVIVQAKWARDSKGSASKDDMTKLRDGLADLLSLKWSSFNSKVTVRRDEIQAMILLEPTLSIDVVFAHMGTGNLADEVAEKISSYLIDLNDPTDLATFRYMGQSDIHRLLLEEHQPPRIDLTVELSDWGQIEGPPMAIYGQVRGSDIAGWYRTYGRPLLAKNVRVILQDSEVNDSIVATIDQNPDIFWYYNNGITVLCNQITKAPVGGTDRRVGTFAFEGASVVNGAQTVGALAKAHSIGRLSELERARVMVRFISLEGTVDNFAAEVTRATNTQNRIGGRDFLSLDPEQARIRDEFAVEGLEYVFRSGEVDPTPDHGCTVVEATIALACSQPTPALATQAKREISRLWDDIQKPPYRTLFSKTTTCLRIWRLVQVMRLVERELASQVKTKDGRVKGIAVHGNRLLLHLIYRQLNRNELDNPAYDWDPELAWCHTLIPATFEAMTEVTETEFPGYPGNIFKHPSKTTEIAERTLRKLDGKSVKVQSSSLN